MDSIMFVSVAAVYITIAVMTAFALRNSKGFFKTAVASLLWPLLAMYSWAVVMSQEWGQ